MINKGITNYTMIAPDAIKFTLTLKSLAISDIKDVDNGFKNIKSSKDLIEAIEEQTEDVLTQLAEENGMHLMEIGLDLQPVTYQVFYGGS